MSTPTPQEHPFAPYVRILGKGRTGSRALSSDEAFQAMTMILQGKVEDVQLGAFMMLLRVKEETAEELAGFAAAIKQQLGAETLPRVDLDWPSYAGKRRQHPWYLLAALALANSGTRVLMHGAAGHTAGRAYSEGVLKALGIAPATDWAGATEQLDRSNFSYLPLRKFCPPLHRIIELRNQFGLRSPVHSLCRLINPCGADYSIQSVFHPSYADSHQQAAQLLGQVNAAVFKGDGGEAERRPEADLRLFMVRTGKLEELQWPRLLQGRQETQPLPGAAALADLWINDKGTEYARAATLGTLAIALYLFEPELTAAQAMEKAEAIWADRHASMIQTPATDR